METKAKTRKSWHFCRPWSNRSQVRSWSSKPPLALIWLHLLMIFFFPLSAPWPMWQPPRRNATSHTVNTLFPSSLWSASRCGTFPPLTLTPEEQRRSDSKKFSAGRVRQDRIQIRAAPPFLGFVLGVEAKENMPNFFYWNRKKEDSVEIREVFCAVLYSSFIVKKQKKGRPVLIKNCHFCSILANLTCCISSLSSSWVFKGQPSAVACCFCQNQKECWLGNIPKSNWTCFLFHISVFYSLLSVADVPRVLYFNATCRMWKWQESWIF